MKKRLIASGAKVAINPRIYENFQNLGIKYDIADKLEEEIQPIVDKLSNGEISKDKFLHIINNRSNEDEYRKIFDEMDVMTALYNRGFEYEQEDELKEYFVIFCKELLSKIYDTYAP